jgi:hypothetical protein
MKDTKQVYIFWIIMKQVEYYSCIHYYYSWVFFIGKSSQKGPHLNKR